MAVLGSLEKMKVTAFRDKKFTAPANAPVNPMEVYVNPESYKTTHGVTYNEMCAQGTTGGSPVFNRVKPDTIGFSLVFDATGALPTRLSPDAIANGVAGQLDDFKRLVLDLNGAIHSPNYVELAWGKLLFTGRLTSLDVDYTLFRPDGAPLRAKTTVGFEEYKDPEEWAKEANKNSPDVAHVRTVQAGSNLPLMCEEVYGSSSYYVEVARVNGLTGFRDLEVGTKLLFPPLQKAAR